MYRERKIIVPNSKNHSFIEPRQERSKKRFEAVLKTGPEEVQKKMDKALGRNRDPLET